MHTHDLINDIVAKIRAQRMIKGSTSNEASAFALGYIVSQFAGAVDRLPAKSRNAVRTELLDLQQFIGDSITLGADK
jgi:hypothetical protein